MYVCNQLIWIWKNNKIWALRWKVYNKSYIKETSSTTNKLVMEMIKSIKLLIISMNHQRNNINGINILIQMSMYYEIGILI